MFDAEKMRSAFLNSDYDRKDLAAMLVKALEKLDKSACEKKDLEVRLEESDRAAHRQAAPFRIPEKKRKTTRKKPGRETGHAGSYRPQPSHVDEEIDKPLEGCPHCGGPVHKVKQVEQFIEDIPPTRPRVTRLCTYRGHCPQCGEVRSTHPLQVSTATGAAKTHLGPNALGLALELTGQHGLERRKTCRILKSTFGLSITPGGLIQATHRMADKLQIPHEAIWQGLREADAAYLDETSWWAGEPGWWLWVGAHRGATVYAIRRSRGREVVYELLGTDFPGVLVSDCLATYDDATVLQHKCYAHHQKAISEAIAQHRNNGKGFLRKMRALLRAAVALKARKPFLPEDEFATRRQKLEESADRLLDSATVDPLEQRIVNRIRKRRNHLFTFLDHDAVDATNNFAERQLRPAVISRKLSCGNRTPRGARTWEVLATVAVTAAQCAESFRHIVANAARLPPKEPAR